MNKLLTLSLSAALFAGVSTITHAQEPTVTPDAKHPRVEQVKERQDKQQDRIEAGEKSGELTKKEDKKLEKDEKRIHQEKKEDREKHDGHLTKGEQEKLNRQQDKVGEKIYDDKHNAETSSADTTRTEKPKAADEKPHGDEKPQQ